MWRLSRVVDLVSRSCWSRSVIAPVLPFDFGMLAQKVSSLGLMMSESAIPVDQRWRTGFKGIGGIVQTDDSGNA